MSSSVDAPGGSLGIVELGDVCARQRAADLELFERLGAWVADTADPAAQRLFAEAAHRHAWHAELWAGRAPAIPEVDLEARTAAHREHQVLTADPADAGERLAAYRAALDRLIGELGELAARVDPDLDPGTTRAIALVGADRRDLRSRAG